MENTYTIQQIAAMTGLSTHTLRYYERIGLLHPISRDSIGYRYYIDSDIAWIEFLMRLRQTGMPISEMKQFSELRSQGDHTAGQRRELLEQHRLHIQEQMSRLEQDLSHMEKKIDYYRDLEAEQKEVSPIPSQHQ
ncbi:MerR family transcriptional regulator [Paenibacillus bovis]|uniref:MerR family transcriptional regulator n=1 Tax=Paenibacillus bovis TaxID=1616788 RepID=A0A172ZFI5_9BACL|nr:MerR family transcriptional regulator [Paenibacillus bovis]ANF95910.1 MerR family transcriptional regulator [Paenibacillus bovis]